MTNRYATKLDQPLVEGSIRTMVLVEDLTRSQIVMYAGASGDYNPLHTDEPFATLAAGYPSVFAHGMLTMGLTGRIITDWVEDGSLRGFSAQFRAQVRPGDTLTATATVDSIVDSDNGEAIATFSLETRNQRDELVLSGQARAAVRTVHE